MHFNAETARLNATLIVLLLYDLGRPSVLSTYSITQLAVWDRHYVEGAAFAFKECSLSMPQLTLFAINLLAVLNKELNVIDQR